MHQASEGRASSPFPFGSSPVMQPSARDGFRRSTRTNSEVRMVRFVGGSASQKCASWVRIEEVRFLQPGKFSTGSPSGKAEACKPSIELVRLQHPSNFWAAGLLGVVTSLARRLISRVRCSGGPPFISSIQTILPMCSTHFRGCSLAVKPPPSKRVSGVRPPAAAPIWLCSSACRTPARLAGCRGFKSYHSHHLQSGAAW